MKSSGLETRHTLTNSDWRSYLSSTNFAITDLDFF